MGTRCPYDGLGDRSTEIDAAKEPAGLLKEYLADYYLTTIKKTPETLHRNASGDFL